MLLGKRVDHYDMCNSVNRHARCLDGFSKTSGSYRAVCGYAKDTCRLVGYVVSTITALEMEIRPRLSACYTTYRSEPLHRNAHRSVIP